jgi:hypothetical protein
VNGDNSQLGHDEMHALVLAAVMFTIYPYSSFFEMNPYLIRQNLDSIREPVG